MELAEYYGGVKKLPDKSFTNYQKCKSNAYKSASKAIKKKGYYAYRPRACNYLKKKKKPTKKRTKKIQGERFTQQIDPDYYTGKQQLNRPCPTNVSRKTYLRAIGDIMGKNISNDPNFATLDNEDLCDILTQVMNTRVVAGLDDYEMDEYPLPPPPLPSDDWMPPPPEPEEDLPPLPPPPDEEYARPPPLPNYNLPPPPPLAPLTIEYKPQRRTQTLDEAFEREFGKDVINKIINKDQPQKSEVVAYCPAPPKITRTVYEELATYPEELQASLLKIYRGQYLTMRELEPLRLYFKIPKTNTKTRKKWSIDTLLAELKKKYREIYG